MYRKIYSHANSIRVMMMIHVPIRLKKPEKNGFGPFSYNVCMVTHIARVWINRIRLPVLHVVS